MATPSAQTSAARKAAPAQQAVLAELVDIARSHAESGLADMVRRVVSALLDLTAAGLDPATVMRRVKSGNLLKDNGYAFTHLATSEIEAALRREVARLLPRDAAPTAAPATAVELSLVPLEQIDQQMALGAVSRPFDLQHSEGLATLGVRLGLLLGRDLVRAAHNPFRPDVFLAAVDTAWRQFEPDPEAHGLVAPLLRPGLMFDLGPLYQALIEALVAKLKARKGATADTRFSKTDDRASRQAERARRDAALAQQLRQLFDPAVPEIPNLPQGSGGWRPSTASGFAVAPPVPAAGAGPSSAAMAPAAHPGQVYASSGAGSAPSAAPSAQPLAHSLSELLARVGVAAQDAAPGVLVLPGLRASLPQGALSRGDETTLDLLSRVFGSVLQDDGVAPETRELIGHLQLPVLRTALRDRSFFFQEAHPARRLLDLLSQAGWERPLDADDPVYRAMRRSVERVRGQVDPEFDVAVADLEAGLAARDHIEEAAMAAPIAQAMRSEKRAAAERSARRAVALRMAGEQLIPAVSGFLEGRWSAALALAYTIEDSRPGAVDNATRTMEDLIWSVKPKATQEQRKALIARLPALLASLNNWLDATRWQDAERLQFFAALAECHASIVRAPIELLPERQLELALEAAQQDALRRVAYEQAQEQEEEREQARLQAEEAQAAASDPAAVALASLERGMRLELNEAHIVRRVRLAWVSPLRTLYIFSGAGRQEAFSLPAARLGELLREGAMRVVAADGVVGRILGAAVEPMPAMV
ncbi:DUF1631 family protein [Massilia sp. CFBP9012]|uniref:DUF1631 family protein n=1 Tax=Massilia sp. CFBP9012 TaxID=3096531 RepID=UPI002A6AF347|nr:DUF1631 family protein [Massilia sp. CFBP9012]MDY0973601.1 DUF1631 family protein [Massilia sp. CFBP9012]